MADGQNKDVPRLSKRMKTVRSKIDRVKSYPVDEALKLVKETATAKFDESVDVAVNLGVDAKKSDQTVRGSVVLPAGTGKKVRVAVFAQGDKAKAATEAGADIVGFDDLAAKVKEGFMDFDVVIATPDAMKVVGQLGQILGPRGLMPNPKVGTVSADVTHRGQERQGGPGPVPHRQGRHHPMHDRARFVHARAAQDQPGGPDRGAEQIEAAGHQGHLRQEDQRLQHDGGGCAGRFIDARAAGTGALTSGGSGIGIRNQESKQFEGTPRGTMRGAPSKTAGAKLKKQSGERLNRLQFDPRRPSADGVPKTGSLLAQGHRSR